MSNLDNTAFDNIDLIPAIIQDASTRTVLMLGYMNREALELTQELGKVTFYSRSKQRLWTKGESSGNFLNYLSHSWDCDNDALLVEAMPKGPTCHTGSDSCWGATNKAQYGFLSQLEAIIGSRMADDSTDSYVARMNRKGLDKIAQKVGEEAVEVVIASKNEDQNELLEEGADLMFHFLLLLKKKNLSLDQIVGRLAQRHEEKREA